MNNSKYQTQSNLCNIRRIPLEKLVQSNEGVYKNARYMNVGLVLMGCPVVLKVKSGDTFHGIFATFSPEFEVVLECCHKIDLKSEILIYGRSLPNKSDVKTLIFPKDDIVEIVATEVDKEFAVKSAESNFIDSAIAQKLNGNKELMECKALQPFPFEETLELLDESTGCDLENTNGGWSADDMLMINEKKYGYKSTYKDDLSEYTVAVEKEDTEEYRKREEEAEKIANEIESSTSYKNNVDKELSDNEEEEAVFSAVDRINGENNERIDSSSSNVADAFANTKENNVNYNNAHVNTSNRSMKNEEKYTNKRHKLRNVQNMQNTSVSINGYKKHQLYNNSTMANNNNNLQSKVFEKQISNDNNQIVNSRRANQSTFKEQNSHYNIKKLAKNLQNNVNNSNNNANQSSVKNLVSQQDKFNNELVESNQYWNPNIDSLSEVSSKYYINDNQCATDPDRTIKNGVTSDSSSITQNNQTIDSLESRGDPLLPSAASSSPLSSSQIKVDCNDDASNNEEGSIKFMANDVIINTDGDSSINNFETANSDIGATVSQYVLSENVFYNDNNGEKEKHYFNDSNKKETYKNNPSRSNEESAIVNEKQTEIINIVNENETPKSKLNPLAQEFNPMRSQVASPLGSNSFIPISHNGIMINTAPIALQQPQIQPTTQILINPNGMNSTQQPLYILNAPTQSNTYSQHFTPSQSSQMKQKKNHNNNETNNTTINTFTQVPSFSSGIPMSSQPHSMSQAPQVSNSRNPITLNCAPQSNPYNNSQINYPTPPVQANGTTALITFPPHQVATPPIGNPPQNQILYQPQTQLNYQSSNLPTLMNNVPIRMYSQSQCIPFTQGATNDLQTQQIYCQNPPFIYSTMPTNQSNLQISQVAQENIGYVASSSTPSRIVGQSAPHTPSPMPQQNQQNTSMNIPSTLQIVNSQVPSQTVMNQVQHNQFQQQQNYSQTYYYISTSQNSMPQSITTQTSIPFTGSQNNQQQFMIVNNQQLNSYVPTLHQQQQNKVFLIQNNSQSYSH